VEKEPRGLWSSIPQALHQKMMRASASTSSSSSRQYSSSECVLKTATAPKTDVLFQHFQTSGTEISSVGRYCWFLVVSLRNAPAVWEGRPGVSPGDVRGRWRKPTVGGFFFKWLLVPGDSAGVGFCWKLEILFNWEKVWSVEYWG
jgi:hypothetical protein